MRSGAKSRGLHFKAKLPHTITIMLGIFNSYLPESLSLVYREERERALKFFEFEIKLSIF